MNTILNQSFTKGKPIRHFKLTKSLSSYPHVDHDPLHDASDAKKDRKEPVCP